MRARSSSRALSTAFALVIALSTPGCGDDDVVGTDGAGVDGGDSGRQVDVRVLDRRCRPGGDGESGLRSSERVVVTHGV